MADLEVEAAHDVEGVDLRLLDEPHGKAGPLEVHVRLEDRHVLVGDDPVGLGVERDRRLVVPPQYVGPPPQGLADEVHPRGQRLQRSQ